MNNMPYFHNFCKKRKFPTYADSDRLQTKKKSAINHSTDYHSVYSMSKLQLGKFLNTWFVGVTSNLKNGELSYEEIWTVKKVDKDTASYLYHRVYNPLFITIMRNDNDAKNGLYRMKAQICSVDDYSYGAWFNEMSLDKLKAIRIVLMKYVNNMTLINGDEWFKVCKECGASKFDNN